MIQTEYVELFIKTEEVVDNEQLLGDDNNNKMAWLAFVDRMANGDILKYDSIYEIRYLTCLNKLALDMQKAKLQNNSIA